MDDDPYGDYEKLQKYNYGEIGANAHFEELYPEEERQRDDIMLDAPYRHDNQREYLMEGKHAY